MWVSKIAKALVMGLLVTKKMPPKPELLSELNAEFVSLGELLQKSDVVTIHVPLIPLTKHMISTNELSLMKKELFL